MKLSKKIILILTLLLTGCAHLYGPNGIIKKRDTDYMNASSIPPLRIPPGYSSDRMNSLYPVSEKAYSTQQMRVNLLPPDLQS